jgi:hypothetical protein
MSLDVLTSRAAPVAVEDARLPCGGTFIALAIGDRAVAPALCLRHQLRLVNTTCSVHVVVDDAIKSSSLARLEQGYGANFVVRLSVLKQHAVRTSDEALRYTRSPTKGRRLLDKAGGVAVVLKYWLWAWPKQETLAYLDLDVLVEDNLDALLDPTVNGLDERRHQLAAVFNCMQSNRPVFVSGVLVFRPSVHWMLRLHSMARFTQWPWLGMIPASNWSEICAPAEDPAASFHMLDGQFYNQSKSNPFKACRHHFKGGFLGTGRILKACEPKFGDQSVLNVVFAGKVVSLPVRFHLLRPRVYDEACITPVNTSRRVAACRYGTARADGVALIHGPSEPKPWNTAPGSRHQMRAQFVNTWHERCAWTLDQSLRSNRDPGPPEG